ncbi:MAG: hypothetical protein LUC86_07895 [Prevotellaceae bacterium]|nr:hypothetical protein [Prevotellaceae bacterium]
MTYKIQANSKGTRSIEVSDEHLETIRRHALFSDLLDSNGIVDESVVEKLRLNVQGLLHSNSEDEALLRLCGEVLFHDNMKAFALHQLISLYIDWNKAC